MPCRERRGRPIFAALPLVARLSRYGWCPVPSLASAPTISDKNSASPTCRLRICDWDYPSECAIDSELHVHLCASCAGGCSSAFRRLRFAIVLEVFVCVRLSLWTCDAKLRRTADGSHSALTAGGLKRISSRYLRQGTENRRVESHVRVPRASSDPHVTRQVCHSVSCLRRLEFRPDDTN
jgi:hypothetical protein